MLYFTNQMNSLVIKTASEDLEQGDPAVVPESLSHLILVNSRSKEV